MENIITEKLDMFYLNEKERKPFSIFEKEGIEIEELFEHIDVDLILQEGLTDISKNLLKKMADSVNSSYKDPKKAKQVAKKYERIVSKVTPQKLDNIISRLSKETDVSDSEIKKAKIDIKRALGAIALGVGSISSNILNSLVDFISPSPIGLLLNLILAIWLYFSFNLFNLTFFASSNGDLRYLPS